MLCQGGSGAGFVADFSNNRTGCVDVKTVVDDREKNFTPPFFLCYQLKTAEEAGGFSLQVKSRRLCELKFASEIREYYPAC